MLRKRMLSVVLAIALVMGCVCSYGDMSYATVTTEATTESTETEDTDDGSTDASVDKARDDAAEAEKKKNEAQEILDQLEDAKDGIEDYIIQLDKALNELAIEKVHLEKDRETLQENIASTQASLELAQGAQEDQYEAMKQRIRMVYETGNKSYLDVLLTATSMTDMMNKTEYMSRVSLYDYNILKELKLAKEQVANLKQKLDMDLRANDTLMGEINAKQEAMELLVEEKSKLVEDYEVSIASQEEEVARYAAAQAEAESIIAAAEAATNGGLVYTGGAFLWPAPSNYTITSYFGNRNSPTAGASSYHKGIDIACDTGDSIVACAPGTVIVATYNYAEGNYVCIDHGSGIVSVYMHNSALQVSVGQSVTAGQVIALAGSTGISTGPHLHFGIRVNGSYVDPLSYVTAR